MKIKNFIYLLAACYFGTFLRIYIDNNLIISLVGSFFFGFVIARKFRKSINKILLSGFCACFTSFSSFIYILYQIINEQDYIKIVLILNIILVSNVLIMYSGFVIGRKLT